MTKKWSSFNRDGTIMNEWKDYLAGNPSKGWYHLLKEEYEKLSYEELQQKAIQLEMKEKTINKERDELILEIQNMADLLDYK